MIESFGEKANLKGGPKNVELEKFAGGSIDSFGAKAPLPSAPSSNKMWGGAGNPIDQFTKGASLSQKPVKGFEGVEVSNRVKNQYK